MNIDPHTRVGPLRAALFVLVVTAAIIGGLLFISGQTGCSTPPSARVVQVQSLLAVGQSAEASVSFSAQLYRDGKITASQARQVLDFYNQTFQPAYRLASDAARGNLSATAGADLLAVAGQLASLVGKLQSTSSPPRP